MDKINLMQGDVLKFADFVCEKLEVSIKPKEITIEQDKECFNAVWSIIEQQCGGDIEKLKEYLSNEYEISWPNTKDIIKYVMELVDDYFTNGIEITQGEQYIKKGKEPHFIDSLQKADYKMVVEDIIMKLMKVENDPKSPPLYAKYLEKLCNECIPENIH